MKRFLIIQTAFLGDVILATPVVSELRRIYPDAEIDFVVRKGNESLLATNPKINRLIVWNKNQHKKRNLIKTIRAIRKVRYDEVITLQRYESAGIMTLLARTKKRIGFDKNAFSWMYSVKVKHDLMEGLHEVERNLKLIASHGAKTLIRPELFPTEKDYEWVKRYQSSPYYCIAPASVWFTKQLPVDKWKQIIYHLITKGKVYLIGGPGDVALCETIQRNFPNNVEILAGQLNLLQSAALMEKAEMNYTNDSGPLHIASAMNATVRAFFLSTIPQYGFGPLSDNSKVIQTKESLDCRPCTFHGRNECPLGHFKCAWTIDVSPENID